MSFFVYFTADFLKKELLALLILKHVLKSKYESLYNIVIKAFKDFKKTFLLEMA